MHHCAIDGVLCGYSAVLRGRLRRRCIHGCDIRIATARRIPRDAGHDGVAAAVHRHHHPVPRMFHHSHEKRDRAARYRHHVRRIRITGIAVRRLRPVHAVRLQRNAAAGRSDRRLRAAFAADWPAKWRGTGVRAGRTAFRNRLPVRRTDVLAGRAVLHMGWSA